MQNSLCTRVMFMMFAAAATVQVKAECEAIRPFRDTGAGLFTVHGAFRDAVVKTFLHEIVKDRLPNSPFFKVGSEEFDLQDIFLALSDALADVCVARFMNEQIDYPTTVRHAFVGHAAHKLWVALLGVLGVTKYISDDVKDAYNTYGKAWFSKAFAISIDNAIARIR